LSVFVIGVEFLSQSSSEILRLKKRFVRRPEEESHVFFAKRQTRLNQQREVCDGARTHARTHARTRTRMHTHTHTH